MPADSLELALTEKQQEQLKNQERRQQEDNKDSIRLAKVLADAMTIATQMSSNDTFSKKYEVQPDNEYKVEVEIICDYLFAKSQRHLMIRRSWPNATNVDIYTNTDGKDTWQLVNSHEEWSMTYINDTIQDINGDGRKDFVVNGYGSTGCCLKAFTDVYLLSDDEKSFSVGFNFINPTFYPKDHLVRGVCYGHPGETEMYKYKWKGQTIDTIEYVYYEQNEKGKTGKVIRSKTGHYSDPDPEAIRLNAIPAEYKTVDGYDWFTGDFN